MQLVIGTYERFLLGYQVPDDLQGAAAADQACNPTRAFTYAAHQGPVRCLDAAGPWLVSGGQDDQLHIYDVKAGKDLGFMMNPGDGAITCVKFFTPPGCAKPSHLLSGSDDGSIAIWSAGGEWEALKLLRGHKGPLRGLSVHPTGRLAVSVGHDRLLKLWHLGKGRCSYTARLEVEADDVAFSADGQSYALLCDKTISLHTVAAEGGLVAKLTHSRRVTAMLLPAPNVAAAGPAATAAASSTDTDAAAAAAVPTTAASMLLCGLDDGRLCLWDVRQPDAPVWEMAGAHKTRIRGLTAVVPGEPGQLPSVIATASSDGEIKLWDSSALAGSSGGTGGSTGGSSDRLVLLGSVSTNGRVTGMVLSAPDRKAAGVAAGAVGAGDDASAAAHQGKKKGSKKQKVQSQQQQGQQPAPQKPPKKQRVQAVQQQPEQQEKQPGKQQQQGKQAGKQQQQQQQGSQGGAKQQQKGGSKHKPGSKERQQLKHQQQVENGDPGFEVVPAPGGAEATAASPQQRKQQQQHSPSAKAAKQQQRKQQKQKQQQQVSNGGDGALVPRVTTIIKKKKQRPGKPTAAAGKQGRGGQGGKFRKPSDRRA